MMCDDCIRCVNEKAKDLPATQQLQMVAGRMFVCPECGNKRCPKATDHRNHCTGSNESGQPGSIY